MISEDAALDIVYLARRDTVYLLFMSAGVEIVMQIECATLRGH